MSEKNGCQLRVVIVGIFLIALQLFFSKFYYFSQKNCMYKLIKLEL